MAPRAAASAAAAVSALTLSTWPVGSPSGPISGATEETTGMRPASITSRMAAGFTPVTSPTSPRSTSTPSTPAPVRRARNRPASSPEDPTAYGPCELISPTSSRPTWPVRTMRTTSMASGVVTRSPPRNSEEIPRRSSIALICGPPPCTTTGCTPTWCRNTTSSANAARSSSETMALPPYLMTMVVPAKRRIHGSASTRTSAFEAARSRRSAVESTGGAAVGFSLMSGLLTWSRRSSRARSRG